MWGRQWIGVPYRRLQNHHQSDIKILKYEDQFSSARLPPLNTLICPGNHVIMVNLSKGLGESL